MFHYKFAIVAGIAATTFAPAFGQGRSGRDRETPRPGVATPRAQQPEVVRSVEQSERQVQRRAGDEARRSVEHRAASVEMAARAAARRNARDASTNPELRRFAQARGVRPEWVAEQASRHADVHASLAASVLAGEPLQLDDKHRSQLEEVFGDADLIQTRKAEARDRAEARDQSGRSGQDGDEDDHVKPSTDSIRPAPGSHANVRARLANAIRVRRSQISELRDRAIETGDEKLLERADRFEKTLDTFLENQARVEANLTEAGQRNRIDAEINPLEPEASDSTIRTAELQADDGLID